MIGRGRRRRLRKRRRPGFAAAIAVRLRINGADRALEIGPSETLLHVLRDRLGLTGSKEGCGLGECGACTVLVGGVPVLSCITLPLRVEGEILTIEGIANREADLRRSFAENGGFQCGFCTPGQVVSASATLLDPACVSEADVRRAMSGNICRCTGYVGIVAAVCETGAHRRIGSES